ncbi:MAG: acetoacetate decarboxylase family protein, partial [Steroidobacterales bacterium]
MGAEIKQGVRYRMPVVFGPAPGPRQKADGKPWTAEETGTMNAQWLSVSYLTHAAKLERLLPPGFRLRDEPVVTVAFSFFNNLYWLAGRGYGIIMVEFPVTYLGKVETIDGRFCATMWEGRPDAIMTGREEIGFPKLFANIPPMQGSAASGAVSGEASWFEHKFFEVEAHGLKEVEGAKGLPGPTGPQLFYKYVPRTSIGGREGADAAYVTTSLDPPGQGRSDSSIDFSKYRFKKWSGSGSVKWHRATF